MFKTIYSKYLASFIILLGLGFCCIALIISFVVTSFSISNKEDMMNKSAKIVYEKIVYEMKEDMLSFEETVSKYENEYIFDYLSEFSDSNIVLIDSDGEVLFENNDNGLVVKNKLSQKTLEKIKKNSGSYKISTLDGLFEKERFNYIYIIEEEIKGNRELVGIILLSSSSSVLQQVYGQIIRAIIIASLWVFFAAIIIVYFVTNKITIPIKQMSKAVQEYSRGNFKVRIPVKGNDEIATLSKAFNEMAQALEKNESTRSNFLSSVSHDLKTPMTSIHGFIEGILDGTIPEEKREYYLGVILEEVKRLTRLVNSLLDISRMESGALKLNPVEFDVCEISRLILISFEEQINQKKINIEFVAENDVSNVFADKDAIYQVIYNIVGNAIKFTNENGLIKIEISKQKQGYLVSIFNTGIGMKQEELPFVFDRFYKSDSSRGLDKTGTGLGLYIAKSKIEAHGEKINVESNYGEYCKFSFTLSENNNNLEKIITKI